MTNHNLPPSPEQLTPANLLGAFERVGQLVQAVDEKEGRRLWPDPLSHIREFTLDIKDGEDRDPDVADITWLLRPKYDRTERWLPSGELMVSTREGDTVYTFGRVIADDLEQPNIPKIKIYPRTLNGKLNTVEKAHERELGDDAEELQKIQEVLVEIAQKLEIS